MRLRRREPEPEPNADFNRQEVVCSGEAAAKAEAERQQSLDDPDEAVWVYLKSDQTGQWLARRTPRHIEQPKDPFWVTLLAELLP